jgi:hypothetical protein
MGTRLAASSRARAAVAQLSSHTVPHISSLLSFVAVPPAASSFPPAFPPLSDTRLRFCSLCLPTRRGLAHNVHRSGNFRIRIWRPRLDEVPCHVLLSVTANDSPDKCLVAVVDPDTCRFHKSQNHRISQWWTCCNGFFSFFSDNFWLFSF